VLHHGHGAKAIVGGRRRRGPDLRYVVMRSRPLCRRSDHEEIAMRATTTRVRMIGKGPMGRRNPDRIRTRDGFSGRQMRHRTPPRPAFPLVRAYVEPPAGIEPATPSLPWNHREPLCGAPFPQVTPDRKGQRYRFSFGEVMRSPQAMHWPSRRSHKPARDHEPSTCPSQPWLYPAAPSVGAARRFGTPDRVPSATSSGHRSPDDGPARARRCKPASSAHALAWPTARTFIVLSG
jgi:hypothetical protein